MRLEYQPPQQKIKWKKEKRKKKKKARNLGEIQTEQCDRPTVTADLRNELCNTIWFSALSIFTWRPVVSNSHSTYIYLRCPRLIFQFCSECLTGSCVSTIFVSCFLLLLELRLDLGVRVFGECFTVCSWTPTTTFSLDGSSGGASGHGVRFDGTVISKGGSTIHLNTT